MASPHQLLKLFVREVIEIGEAVDEEEPTILDLNIAGIEDAPPIMPPSGDAFSEFDEDFDEFDEDLDDDEDSDDADDLLSGVVVGEDDDDNVD